MNRRSMSDIRKKKLLDDEYENLIEFVTISKNATGEQKSQFAAVIRYDKVLRKEITEFAANNDLKSARKKGHYVF